MRLFAMIGLGVLASCGVEGDPSRPPPGWQAYTVSSQETVELAALFGQGCALHVDRAWDSDDATVPPTFPSDDLAEVDYVAVADGVAYPLALSADGNSVEVDASSGAISEADAVSRRYRLDDGTVAGGRLLVWIDGGEVQGELTLYGSGVPVLSSERGPVTCD